MGANSKISWCNHTWNPWYGCPDDGQRSPACDNCYARAWAKRFNFCDFDREIKRASDKTFYAPLNRKIYKPGDKVFVCSLSDFFHSEMPQEFLEEAWHIIWSRTDLSWIFLTKRPQNITAMNWSPGENSRLGVTVENQIQANKRIPKLLEKSSWVHFVSIEPMLEGVNICKWLSDSSYKKPNIPAIINNENPRLDWVICGGESGPGARPINPDWLRKVRDDCQAAGVPFFFKQWGKKPGCLDAGRVLDGREWLEFPKT